MSSVIPSFEELNSVALKLHSVISANQDDPNLRMGVPFRENWDALATKLKRGSFRKPFLTSNRTWVRNIVLSDPHAFAFLAPHIRLVLIVNGKIRYWNGWGGEITRDPEDPTDFLEDQLGPYWLEFLLGKSSTLFVGILESL